MGKIGGAGDFSNGNVVLKQMNKKPFESYAQEESSESTTALNVTDSSDHPFINVKVLLGLLCWFCITQGFGVNGVNNVNIPMLERRFKLTSTQSGLEASFYDISAGLSVLFVGYFGGNGHQPRILAFGALSLAAGMFVMSIPHLTTDSYQPSDIRPPICDIYGNSTATVCSKHEEFLSNYLYVFLLGQALNGIGGTCLYTLGIAYIDGSVSSKMSPLYLGLFYASSSLGPAIGYVLGGYFLDVYVDTPKPPPYGLTTESPAWVGAWWYGYLAAAVSSLVVAIPLLFFPKVLPGSEERRKNNVNQAHHHGTQHKAEQEGFGISIRDIPISFLLLLKNPAFLCQCFMAAVEGFILSGLTTFSPKFIANQFRTTASWASMLTGFVAVPGAVAGQFFGGFILRKLNLKIPGMLKMNMICNVTVMIFAASFWAKCDLGTIAGVTQNYNGSNELNLTSECNANCGCTQASYEPVCIGDIQYFSACHAGCQTSKTIGDKTVYENCICAEGASGLNNSTMTTAVKGKCPQDCIMLWIFIAFVFVAILFTFFMTVPTSTIVIRSVSDKQRAFAVSIQQCTMRFLGTIPGPLAFGALLDQSCLTWQEKCDNKGSCWIYDNLQMSRNFFILMFAGKVLSFLLSTIALCLYKAPPTKEDNSSTDIKSGEVNEGFSKL